MHCRQRSKSWERRHGKRKEKKKKSKDNKGDGEKEEEWINRKEIEVKEEKNGNHRNQETVHKSNSAGHRSILFQIEAKAI